MQAAQLEHLRMGLSDLRKGALFNLIGYAMLLVAMMAMLSFLPMILQLPSLGYIPYSDMMLPKLGLTEVLLILLPLLIALLIGLMGFYYFFRSTGHLKRFDAPRLGIGRTGMTLQLIGLIAIIVGLPATIFSIAIAPYGSFAIYALFGMLGIALVAVALLIVGDLLFGVMLIRMGEVEGLAEFKTAGIIYVVGPILTLIPLISFVGLLLDIVAQILIYVYSGRGIGAPA
ncbi:MAG: DUF973 family protein [Candidatus Korarchaeota archaeon NZ13-K]|nr:MAG: DUF973 family protein [Candidatus Korarchaeota archaeon NZ13-K]